MVHNIDKDLDFIGASGCPNMMIVRVLSISMIAALFSETIISTVSSQNTITSEGAYESILFIVIQSEGVAIKDAYHILEQLKRDS